MYFGLSPLRRTRSLLCAVLLCFAGFTGNHAMADDQAKSGFLQTSAAEHYENALALIDSRSYKEALVLLRRLQAYYPGFEKLSSVQTRIAVLQEADDSAHVLGHYLSALDKRDSGDVEGALSALSFILLEYKDSTLHDDALYLKAYVQIMDHYDFAAARTTLAELSQTHGASSYQDSAEYLDAIALEQMGDTQRAKLALEALRERHTAVSLPFGFSWPDGNVLSRYWYDRADRRLAIIEKSTASASVLRSKQFVEELDSLQIQVSVDGVDLEYQLTPSPLTRQTAWVDGVLQDRSPPEAGVFVGKVVGDDDSWVRAVINDNSISGKAYAFGRSYTMQPGTLIGTLDYYQPMAAKLRSADKPDSVSTEVAMQLDSINAPALGAATARSITTKASDLRVVPVSIVIDAEFDRYHGGTGLVVALNQLNVADGIYRQFGIALAVDEVQVFGDDDDNPMHSEAATLETFLNSFRQYRMANKALFADSALTYLFTGKQRTDRTLGLAWIDTLCRTDGYDVGVTTPSAIGDVLLTHELGHSLGSQHDSDTSCNQDSSKLMWPNISTRTQIEFSDCSLDMLSGARSKACLVDAVDLELAARGTSNGVEFELSNLDSSVAIDAALTIETSYPDMLALPAGCNKLSPTSASCAISRMSAGERRVVALQLSSAVSASDAIVTAQLMPVGTQDFTPSNNLASYSIASQSSSLGHLAISSDAAIGAQGSNGESGSPAAASGGSFSISSLMVLLLLQLIPVMRAMRPGWLHAHRW